MPRKRSSLMVCTPCTDGAESAVLLALENGFQDAQPDKLPAKTTPQAITRERERLEKVKGMRIDGFKWLSWNAKTLYDKADTLISDSFQK
jgi:hypothetical protein